MKGRCENGGKKHAKLYFPFTADCCKFYVDSFYDILSHIIPLLSHSNWRTSEGDGLQEAQSFNFLTV